jgi:hypothetical protein
VQLQVCVHLASPDQVLTNQGKRRAMIHKSTMGSNKKPSYEDITIPAIRSQIMFFELEAISIVLDALD